MQPQRDLYIDFLRFIGISLIILAHVEAPSGITQFRSFDVPLMVFVSGLSFSTKGGGFWKYVWKRVKRLCIPVYLFLTILFTAVIGAGIVGLKNPWGWDQIAGTYLLLNEPNIGYVWIIRVFLMMSIIAPPLYPLVAKMNMHKFILVLFLILGIQGLLVKSSNYIYSRLSNILPGIFSVCHRLQYPADAGIATQECDQPGITSDRLLRYLRTNRRYFSV